MQIGWVEVARSYESFPVLDRYRALVGADEPLVSKALEHPIDVDGGKPDGVGDLLLGHGKDVVEHLAVARSLKPDGELAQQVRNPRARVTAPDTGDPLAKPGPIDKRVEQHRAPNGWMRIGNIPHGLRGDQGYLANGQHLHTVISDAKERRMKVDHVAWNVDRKNLPCTVADNLVAISKARKQHATALCNIRFPDDVAPCTELLNGSWQG